MLISNSTIHALNDIAARERDAMQVFAPGAAPERNDVARRPDASFALDALSAAPPPDAYFITRDERGRLLFTRDGSFAMSEGALVDAAGRPILGFAEAASTLTPLRADPVDTALGLVADARIDPDGSVTYDRATVDPRTGRRELHRATLGRIALARFAPGTKLQAVDAQHAAAPGAIAPHVGRPGDGNFSAIAPFERAGSGIDLDLGLQRLQEAYLALDAICAADKARASVEKTAMDLLK
jgi:hypothetical protein